MGENIKQDENDLGKSVKNFAMTKQISDKQKAVYWRNNPLPTIAFNDGYPNERNETMKPRPRELCLLIFLRSNG